MGAIMKVSDCRHFSGVYHGELPRWSVNPGSRSVLRSLCSYKISPHITSSFRYSRTPDPKGWFHSSHKMNVVPYVSGKSAVPQLTDERSAERMVSRAIKLCKSLTVFAIVLSTVLGGTPARAGVESTLQPKFSGLVDASTNKVSSVEAILAKQLARRFREMSDEELVLVLQELLKASRASISPEDLVLDGKGRGQVLLENGSKEGNRKTVDDGAVTIDSFRQSGEARNEGPDLSASSSKFEDSRKKIGKEDSYSSVDGVDRASEQKAGEAKIGEPEMSVPDAETVDEGAKQRKAVLPGSSRVPGLGKETSDGALTTENSKPLASSAEETDEAELSSERSDKVGRLDGQDMTGILWDEWLSRLEGRTILESDSTKGSSIVSSTRDVWQQMQISTGSALKGARKFSAWISDNREAVGGGVLASGSILSVLFIRQKIGALSLGKGRTNEADLKVDQPPSNARLSASSTRKPGQVPRGFLQSVPASFRAVRKRLLGSEEGVAQFEKASSGTTSFSQGSGQSTMTGPGNLSLYIETDPTLRLSDDELSPERLEARMEAANPPQDVSSNAASLARPSERVLDRIMKTINDKQRDTGDGGPVSKFRTGPQIGDAVYGSGTDDSRSYESLDIQGRKNDEEYDVVYKNPRFPPSVSAKGDDGNKRLESSGQIESTNSYMADASHLDGTRVSRLTSKSKDERSLDSNPFRRSGQGMTVNKRTVGEPREKVELAPSERRQDVGKFKSFQSNLSQRDTRESDVQGYWVSESSNKPSTWSSSRPIQLDPLAYRRRTAGKELDTADSQDGFRSASIVPDDVKEGFSRRKRANTRSARFLSGGSEGEKGPSSMQITQGERATPRSLGSRGSSRNSKTFPLSNAGSSTHEDIGSGTELSQKTYTEERLLTRTSKQDPFGDDPFTNNRPTVLRDADQFSVMNEAEPAEYETGRQGDNAGAPGDYLNIQTKTARLEKVNGQSSGTDVPYSGAEQNGDRDKFLKSISTGTLDTALDILPKSTRELFTSDMEVRNGKVTETPVTNAQGATLITQKIRYDEEMIRLATSLESEVKEENSALASASKADARLTGRDMQGDDMWASSGTTAFGGKGSKRPYNDAIRYNSDDFEARSSGGREFESKSAGESRPELDSFFHKQSFWVRDSDGVFIKHPRESQGKMFKDREGRKTLGNDSGLNDEAVDASIADTGASTKLNRHASPSVWAHLHDPQSSSSGFDYRQLYLAPNDDNESSGEPYGNKTPGSKKDTTSPSPSGSGKTKPISYGVERTG